jgi:hypothetical protein
VKFPQKSGISAVQRVFEAGLVDLLLASKQDARLDQETALLGVGLGVHSLPRKSTWQS